MEELKQICWEILAIEEKLMYGQIPFEYDSLMCALKPGHPMEILDDMLSQIFWDVQAGREPLLEALRATLEDFKSFRAAFKVNEMTRPIKEIEEYIKGKEESGSV